MEDLGTRGIILMTGIMFIGISSAQSDFILKNEYLNRRYSGSGISEIIGLDHHGCVKECMSFSMCKSVDYVRPSRTCKLNNVSSSEISSSSLEIVTGAIFSDISDWPSDLVGNCRSRPCSDFQRCIPGIETYQCRDIECEYVKLIDNGKIQITGRTLMDSATVVCNEGYFPTKHHPMCQVSAQWEPALCTPPIDCLELKTLAPNTESGVYRIQVLGIDLSVYCDMETDGGGWTVFQKRHDGSVNFYRGFTGYENGFGTADEEHWLGLKYIKALAAYEPSEMMLYIMKWDGATGLEKYENFKLIGPEYTFSVDRLTYGFRDYDNLIFNNGSNFTTFDVNSDVNNDVSNILFDVTNCATSNHGAWWYINCETNANLNGLYCTSELERDCSSFIYTNDGRITFKESKMMLRRVELNSAVGRGD